MANSTDRKPSIVTRPLAEQVTWYAERSMADRGFAVRNGIAPMSELPLFAAPDPRPGGPSHADWLRGAALALLPSTQRHVISEGTNGHGHLVLLDNEAA